MSQEDEVIDCVCQVGDDIHQNNNDNNDDYDDNYDNWYSDMKVDINGQLITLDKLTRQNPESYYKSKDGKEFIEDDDEEYSEEEKEDAIVYNKFSQRKPTHQNNPSPKSVTINDSKKYGHRFKKLPQVQQVDKNKGETIEFSDDDVDDDDVIIMPSNNHDYQHDDDDDDDSSFLKNMNQFDRFANSNNNRK